MPRNCQPSDAILGQLRGAVGLAGRVRRNDASAERGRELRCARRSPQRSCRSIAAIRHLPVSYATRSSPGGRVAMTRIRNSHSNGSPGRLSHAGWRWAPTRSRAQCPQASGVRLPKGGQPWRLKLVLLCGAVLRSAVVMLHDIPGKSTDAGLAAAVFWRLTPDASFPAVRQEQPAPRQRFLDVDHVP